MSNALPRWSMSSRVAPVDAYLPAALPGLALNAAGLVIVAYYGARQARHALTRPATPAGA